jgi:hypothetical protein
MRIIRTEMYFEREGILQELMQSNRGIAVCWIGVPGQNEQTLMKLLHELKDERNFAELAFDLPTDRLFENFVSAALTRDTTELNVGELHDPQFQIGSAAELTFALDQNIVIEQSPPTTVKLKELAKKSPGILIGSYVGMEAAGDAHALLFMTVPLGIVIVGSAIGISEGIPQGLNQLIQKKIKSLSKARA